MGDLFCAPEKGLPRASQLTQVSSTSLRLSRDEIQNLSQLPWLPSFLGPCWLSRRVFKPTKNSVLQGPQKSRSACSSLPRKLSSFRSLLHLLLAGSSPSRPLSRRGGNGQQGLEPRCHREDSCLLSLSSSHRAPSHPGRPAKVSELAHPDLAPLVPTGKGVRASQAERRKKKQWTTGRGGGSSPSQCQVSPCCLLKLPLLQSTKADQRDQATPTCFGSPVPPRSQH